LDKNTDFGLGLSFYSNTESSLGIAALETSLCMRGSMIQRLCVPMDQEQMRIKFSEKCWNLAKYRTTGMN
jgi:hypothetical protein